MIFFFNETLNNVIILRIITNMFLKPRVSNIVQVESLITIPNVSYIVCDKIFAIL